MDNIIRKMPLPITGLMLGLAAAGNLVQSYGSVYRSIFGIISSAVLIMIIVKVIVCPKALIEGFDNPVVASVMPTFPMGIMILSTYIKPYIPSIAFGIWSIGLLIHVVLILCFTKKYILNFNIKKVFPSFFIVYVGIAAASVTAPAHNMAYLGQAIFWFAFISYVILLPIIIYRVIAVKEIPEPALPTIAIFAAPASLCLAGYLSSFQQKNMVIVEILAIISVAAVLCVLLYMPKLLKLKFYPSYSAFTFPFVISAIAVKGLNSFLTNTNRAIPMLVYVVKLLELWAVMIVLYVLVKYIIFIVPGTAVVSTEAKSTSSS